jgi:hypothetical protein
VLGERCFPRPPLNFQAQWLKNDTDHVDTISSSL